MALARQEAKAACRAASFEALAAAWTGEQIADMRKGGPRTIRREGNATLEERPAMTATRYAGLQIARLPEAVRVADVALHRGDLRAVAAMVTAAQALDRYHGPAGASTRPERPFGACGPPGPAARADPRHVGAQSPENVESAS